MASPSGWSRQYSGHVAENERVDVNPQTTGYLERGDYKPSLELAMKIAQVFDVPVEAIFSFSPFESVASLLRQGRGS